MTKQLDDAALDQLFRTARTHNGWVQETLPEALYREVYELMKFGPTSANTCPARFVWVTSEAGRKRLAELAAPGNAPKILEAPCTVIVGHDLQFAEMLPILFPHNPDMKDYFRDPRAAETTASRNGTLQGAYLIIAARAMGLDCGPMSGFDQAGVDKEFFAGTTVKSNFICVLGHGTEKNLFPRSPRLSFEDANRFA
ncbi:MAG: malonic semialdehyde reductase [Gammaproteobacteria bacterium]|nr:malonic semialdehyde reductase [Gammaproteobacteria bacterium]